MNSLGRPPFSRRALLFSAQTLVAATLSASLIGLSPQAAAAWPLFAKSPAKSQGKGSAAPAKPAEKKPEAPEFADPYPSPPRPAAPDLDLAREEQRKAEALASFADAVLAEDSAEADRALAGYRKTLEADPGYTELAIKVAYELAKRNDVAGGIQVLKDSIKAAPKDARPLIFLSQLYSKHLRKPDIGLKYAEQGLALAPESFAGYLALFELHLGKGDVKKAETVLDKAAKVTTFDPQFWIQLGDLYTRLYLKDDGAAQQGELEKMNVIYRKAADLGKKDATVLTKVGDYFVLSRQVKEAIPFYLSALTQQPDPNEAPTSNLREKLARAFIVTDQRDEAIRLLEGITKDFPNRFETFELLGELYEQKGDVEKALSYYEHSIQLDASEPRNYLRFSEMLLRTKRYERAIETMRTARKRFPDRPDITFSLALTLSQAKKHTEAMTTFAEAQAEAEQTHEEMLTAQFYFQYGAAAEQAGLTEKAAELLQKCIDLEPANAAQAYNYLGYMWVDRGERLDEGGELIRKALELDPDNGAFLDSYGWFFYKKGDFQRALKELLRAAEVIKPDDAVVFEHIADTYQALGKTGEALTFWQKALALDSENKKLADKIDAAKQKVTSGK